MTKNTGFLIIFFIFIYSRFLHSHSDSTYYYNVIEKDSLYYVLDKFSLSIYSSNGDGKFYLQTLIPSNYDDSTKIAVNEKYILIHNQDSLYIYNKEYPFEIISKKESPFPISSIHPFNIDFVTISNLIIKIIGLNGDSIKVKNDSVTVFDGQLISYPFLIKGTNIYKYVEGFGYYHAYILDEAISTIAIYKNTLVYHTWRQPNLRMPPSECDLEIRQLEEPTFPQIFSIEDWGIFDYNTYHSSFNSVSNQYIKLIYSPQELIYNYNAKQICSDNNSDITLIVTDRYIFKLGRVIEYSTAVNSPALFYSLEIITNFKNENTIKPVYHLQQNHPNPFNPNTKISWQTPLSGWQTLKVYDGLGNEVATLVDEYKPSGQYEVEFNSNTTHRTLASGIYFYQLRIGEFMSAKKMVLLR